VEAAWRRGSRVLAAAPTGGERRAELAPGVVNRLEERSTGGSPSLRKDVDRDVVEHHGDEHLALVPG
jgi:hypothetical protein